MDPPSSAVASPPDSPILEDSGSLPRREITYLDGLAIVTGIQIGAGIFSTPAVVAANVQSVPGALLVWLAAGLLVWTGAASFIELGTRIPTNGGMQQYLRLCFGDTYGFLFAWTWIFVMKPTSAAMISTIFAEYFCWIIAPSNDDGGGSTAMVKVVALVALAAMTGLNCAGANLGTRFAHGFLALKILGLLSIGFAGLVYAVSSSRASPGIFVRAAPPSIPVAVSGDHRSLWEVIGGVADSMFAALFAYGGWDNIGYVVGEIHKPIQTLPRILHHAMALVVTLFLMATVTMYSVVPLDDMDSDAIAVKFGRLVFGETGAIMYSAIVCMACLGTLNATIIAVGRLTEAASQQQYIPRFIGMPSAPSGYAPVSLEMSDPALPVQTSTAQLEASTTSQAVPTRAMLANGILGALYLISGSFRGLITFKGIAEYFGHLYTMVGLIRLQHGWIVNPALTPAEYYHTWRALPLVFSITSSMLVFRSGIQHPLQVVGIVGFLIVGLLVRRSKWWQKLVMAPEATPIQGVS